MLGRRSDGYHELRTLFQTVAAHDLLRLELSGEDVTLDVSEGDAPSGRDNLALRAAELYFERFPPREGLRVELRKRLPIGGGLGGGSSNAATVLAALDGYFERARPGELWSIARELGADVPFFLVGGTALGFGRGDEVVPLNDLPPSDVFLIIPPVSVSTPEVFARLSNLTADPLPSSIVALAQGEEVRSAAAAVGRNDLERTVLGWVPLLREVYNALFDAGASEARLSGSGASFFAFFDGTKSIGELEARLPTGTVVVKTRTLDRVGSTQNRISLGDWADASDRDQGLPG